MTKKACGFLHMLSSLHLRGAVLLRRRHFLRDSPYARLPSLLSTYVAQPLLRRRHSLRASPYAHGRSFVKHSEFHASMNSECLTHCCATSFMEKLILPILSLPRHTTVTLSPRVRTSSTWLILSFAILEI